MLETEKQSAEEKQEMPKVPAETEQIAQQQPVDETQLQEVPGTEESDAPAAATEAQEQPESEAVSVEEAEEQTQPESEAVSIEEAEEQTQPAENETAAAPAKKEAKKLSKKTLIIIGAGAACALVAFLLVLLLVIVPNNTYNNAVKALDDGNFQECERLINKIPNHKKVPELRVDLDIAIAKEYIEDGELELAESMLAKITGSEKAKKLKADIQYLKAAELIEKGEISEAKLLLEKIPDYEDSKQLHEQIKYAEAMAAVESGDYETAYAKFSELADYQDAAEQKDTVYYEALAFKSLFKVQERLKNPASLRVTKVTFYQNSSSEGELDALFEYTASNSYGGSVGAYACDLTVYEEGSPYIISFSDYVDPGDYDEYLLVLVIGSVKNETVVETTVDIARMNRLLESNVSFKIALPFQSGAVVES